MMHIAALNGHPETAHMLFKKGVPLLMPNKVGSTFGVRVRASGTNDKLETKLDEEFDE